MIKTRITKFVAVLSVLLFVFSCFASCGKESETQNTKPEWTKNDPRGPFTVCEGNTFMFDVNDSYVLIFKDDDMSEPSQAFPHNGVEDINYSLDAMRFEDVNFDSFPDLLVPSRKYNAIQYYSAYLWNNESGLFESCSALGDLGGIYVCDGYLESEFTDRSGTIYKTKYYWDEDGELLEESLSDEDAERALAFSKIVFDSEDLTVSFISDELVDKSICKKYTVNKEGEQIGLVCVNYDGSRLFMAGEGDCYIEMKPDGEGGCKKEASFARDTYDGEPYSYFREAYDTLNASAKQYYESMYEKVMNVDQFKYDSEDAVSAVKALLTDNPLFDCYFTPVINETQVTPSYFYSWAPYADSAETDPEVVRNALKEFDEYIMSIVSEMPNGLCGTDRYIYLAQKFQIAYLETHEHGLGDSIGNLIKGDSDNERFAKTYCYICEKANLYCTVNGSTNIVKFVDVKTEVDVRSAARCIPGAEDWKSAFFMN